jgi:lipid-binding SYLF domain-containing protein
LFSNCGLWGEGLLFFYALPSTEFPEKIMHKVATYLIMLALLLLSNKVLAFEPNTSSEMELDVKKAILEIKEKAPSIQKFFDSSVGYAIFPSVGKGGFVIGGAFGRGLVIVNEQVDGYTSLSQATIGAQVGGQKYSQFIFFKDQTALDNFKRGNFEFGAQASAVAITASASVDTSYDAGVAVFTNASGGLMAEATIGGQRFSYAPKISD